ncbi:hypothetical protein WR25_02251 [Diploscapter pachys]|uniref:RING-type domain-containing protein n=1 Tax=Diploscapter pachys TaxID=2018661 RepID=A0A2A2LF58_9BILA|nr:hypothetical protein WR25_02251 [Diploscapter pachys]
MGNCLPRLLSFGRGNMEGAPMRRSPSTSTTSSQDGPMSFSNPMMLSQNSPYVSQLYAANVRRQRQANQQEKDLEAAKQKRIQGLLEQISADIFTEDMKAAECAICMIDFEPGDCIRFLPCMHSFHKDCVDEWLHK